MKYFVLALAALSASMAVQAAPTGMQLRIFNNSDIGFEAATADEFSAGTSNPVSALTPQALQVLSNLPKNAPFLCHVQAELLNNIWAISEIDGCQIAIP